MKQNSALTIYTTASEQTNAWGFKIGALLEAGHVLLLDGPLGCGKTVFVQGLARGMGVPADTYVTSPSYTLINEHEGRLRLFHVDLYRLESPEAIEEIGLAEIVGQDGVTAIEWGHRLPAGFVTEYLAIDFTIEDDDSRRLGLRARGQGYRDLLDRIGRLIRG
jgi:tRNA threonylcarbamoyladenosine biosynthesis protein TsaE